VFQELLALDPARTDARIELAAIHVANRRPNDAMRTLGTGPWPSDNTPRALSIVAAAELQRNRRGAARSAIDKLLACAQTPEYREIARRLMKMIH
jgi:hypothetical protein